MIFYSRDFPSQGRASEVDHVNLMPLNYGQLIEYINNDELTKLRSYMRDVNLLLKMDPGASKVSVIDLDYVIYMMKVLTISDELKYKYSYTCECCHKKVSGTISSKNLIFRDIDPRYFELLDITLGGIKLTYTGATVEKFQKFCAKLPRLMEDFDVKILKLASMFWDEESMMHPGKVVDLFLKATHDEVKLVAYLKSAYFDTIKPFTMTCEKGGKTVVALNDATTGLFRRVLQNGELKTDKIHFREVDEDKEHRDV